MRVAGGTDVAGESLSVLTALPRGGRRGVSGAGSGGSHSRGPGSLDARGGVRRSRERAARRGSGSRRARRGGGAVGRGDQPREHRDRAVLFLQCVRGFARSRRPDAGSVFGVGKALGEARLPIVALTTLVMMP